MGEHLLLTGATGLIGRYLLRDLRARGVPVAALVRPSGGEGACERLAALLGADVAAEEGLVALEGDVAAPWLGLSRAARAWVARKCGRVLHAAASLRFQGADREGEPWRTNEGGVRNVVALCRAVGIGELHHVSTAFVCGRREGVARETDPAATEGLRNDYERSKAAAEHELAEAHGLRVTLHRPSIVVGDSRTGATTSYHGPYAWFRFVATLARRAQRGPDGRWHLPLRVDLTGDEGLDLVPVDWVSAAIVRIVLEPRLHGGAYHLAAGRRVTLRAIERAAAARYGCEGARYLGPGGLEGLRRNGIERLFDQAMALYRPYWDGRTCFDTTRLRAALPDLAAPRVDARLLARLIDFAERDGWGARPADPLPSGS